MKTKELLNKYFEGETSCEEEKKLREFFAKGDVPEDLHIYRPFFAYFEEESSYMESRKQKAENRRATNRKKIKQYLISGVAAGLFLILGVAGVYKLNSAQSVNYVIIDGKRYTDASLIRQQAQAAFNDVSFSREDIFDSLFE